MKKFIYLEKVKLIFENKMSNIILAIDSSIDFCSVAIYKKQYIYSLSTKCTKQHNIKMLPMIQKILLQTKTKLKELNYVSFSKGPGNFTGIRIAAGIAHSLSISLKIPIFGISTLAIMAEKAWRKYKQKKIIVAINAKKTEVYWAEYIRNKNSVWIGKHTESLLKKELIINKINNFKTLWTLVGNIWHKIDCDNCLNINKTKIFFPDAKDIIPFVLLKIKNKKVFSSENNINYLYNTF